MLLWVLQSQKKKKNKEKEVQGRYFNVKYSFKLYCRDQYSPYKQRNWSINNFSGALQ